MSEKPQEFEEQLNIQTPDVAAAEEEFSLEDIMREFGGWTRPAEEPEAAEESALEELTAENEPEPEPEVSAQQPETEPEQDKEEEKVTTALPKAEKLHFVSSGGDTIRFQLVTPEETEEEKERPVRPAAVMPEEPKSERPDRKRQAKLRKRERRRKKALRRAERARRREEPERVYPSPEEACAVYAKVGTLRVRLLISLLLTGVSAVLMYFGQNAFGALDLTKNIRGISVIMLALLLGQALCAAEILLRGVQQAIRLRLDLSSMITAAVVLTVLDAFRAIAVGRMPLCTVTAFALLLALWSVSLEKQAKWRTLKTVLSMDAPVAAVKEEKAWRGLDCVFRREGNLEDFTAMLETPDAATKAMRIYVPGALLLTFALAVFSAVKGGADFLWSWSVLVTAALPAGGFLACWRPFSVLARRLHRAGAAVCGWRGAKILSGEAGIVIRDDDLFPKNNISMNGVKMYSDLHVRQVVGYATAVIRAAGSGLLPLFEEMMKNENGWRCSVDTFRQYEGGGLGAEIRGDVVLLGSLGFMRLMGIPVPEGTKIQSAIYVSVNGELTGVFALTYGPSAASKSGLQHVVHTQGLVPILATRDFMITPGLVKKRFKVSADRLEFPMVAERAALSAPEAGENGKQGALMARGSFAAFAEAVTGSRSLRRTVHGSMWVSVLSGLLGMLLLCILTYLDAESAASAGNLLLYQLLWQIPNLLLTGMIGKS